jgi:hypothetical protein
LRLELFNICHLQRLVENEEFRKAANIIEFQALQGLSYYIFRIEGVGIVSRVSFAKLGDMLVLISLRFGLESP